MMTLKILATIFLTACYFVIGIITAVYKQQQLNDEHKKDRAQQMIESVLNGLFWPLVIISYAAKKAERKMLMNCLLVGIILLISAGCTDSTPYQDEKIPLNNPRSTALITEGQINVRGSDGCDYIYWYDIILETGGLTHSGSCKQCWNRMDSLLKANKN